MICITDIKNTLHDDRTLEVLSHSVYLPTREKMISLADKYQKDETTTAFGWYDGPILSGIIVIKHINDAVYEIMNISVDPASQKQGVGTELIKHAFSQLKCKCLIAETDDDAVGFYRKLGFTITSLGQKYEGVTRYLCSI